MTKNLNVSSNVEPSCSTVDCNSLCNNSFVPDKDLRGRSVVLLQSTVLHEMLDITTDMCHVCVGACVHR